MSISMQNIIGVYKIKQAILTAKAGVDYMAYCGQDFEHWYGDDKIIVVEVFSDIDKKIRTNLTGCNITWELLPSDFSNTPILTKSTGNGVAITDAINGKFEITISHNDTIIAPNLYYHKAYMTDTGGLKTTILSGTMRVKIK